MEDGAVEAGADDGVVGGAAGAEVLPGAFHGALDVTLADAGLDDAEYDFVALRGDLDRFLDEREFALALDRAEGGEEFGFVFDRDAWDALHRFAEGGEVLTDGRIEAREGVEERDALVHLDGLRHHA